MREIAPTAKGVLLRADTKEQLQTLSRGGRTAEAEHLLIGTLYSQFAERCTTLAGTVELSPGGFKLYTEAMQGSKRFLLGAEVQSPRADTSEATFVELRPDEYEGSND
jgi:hypothetical protein